MCVFFLPSTAALKRHAKFGVHSSMTGKPRWHGFLWVLGLSVMLTACESEYSVGVIASDMDRVDTLQSGGLTRTYALHLPADYETNVSPVVILFHGLIGNGQNLQNLTAMGIDAEQYGLLPVYPNATSDWAYGCDCTEAEAAGVDDVQFVIDLLDELDNDYGINRDSVFVVGYAEGAFMAHKVVCDTTDLFAGLATVSATMLVSAAETCAPPREIPVLLIHGTEDEDSPWFGALDRGLESVLSADSTAQFWATSNGCGDRLERQYVMRDTYHYFDVYRDAFDACPANGEVLLYQMFGAGHGWPNAYFSASPEIAAFFAAADP